MSLDARVIDALPSVEANLNYLIPTREKPFRYTYEPSPGTAADNTSYAPHRFRIHDARQVGARVSLDDEGFALVKHRSAVRNFYDDAEVRQVYYPEAQRLLIEATGAAIQAEAQQKQCDYVVFTNVSHKKGGGGFGSVLSSSVGQIASNVGYGSGTAAVIATNTVVAATVAQNIKAKDELTLDARLERPGSTTPSFAQQFKGKAKSAGDKQAEAWSAHLA